MFSIKIKKLNNLTFEFQTNERAKTNYPFFTYWNMFLPGTKEQ